MKKIVAIMLAAGLVSVSLFGCTASDTNVSSNTSATENSNGGNSSSNSEASVTAASSNGTVTDYRIEADADTTFKLGSDDQPFFISKTGMNISDGNGAYTFFQDTLYYYDNNSQTTVVACGKPDCVHDTNSAESECNAYFPADEFYYDKGFSYCDNNLYLLGKGSSGNTAVSLYKISADASAREKVCTLFETSDMNNIGVFTLHRGYAFWSLNTEDGAELFRMSLSDKKVEQVYKSDKYAAYITRFVGAGDYLYFSNTYALDEDLNEWDGTILRLNIHSGKTDELVNTTGCFTVLDNKIYYFDDENLCVCNLDGSDAKEFITAPENSWLVVSDTKYLYLTNWDNDALKDSDGEKTTEWKLFVVDTDSKIKDTISIDDCEFFRGGYSDNLYIETTNQALSVFDKAQIGTDAHEWKTVLSVSGNGEVNLNE